MATPTEVSNLAPPSSMLKLAGFLGDIRSRSTFGNKVDIQDAWDRHDISITDIDGFLGWLHVPRDDKPATEQDLSRQPVRSLAKKLEKEEPGPPVESVNEPSAEQDSSINLHLWNTLFRAEPRKRRKEIPQAKNVALGNRAGQFANGYNGNLMLTQMALTQQDSAKNSVLALSAAPEMSLPPNAPKPDELTEHDKNSQSGHLTNGLAAAAFGTLVAGRANGMQPLWNEPVHHNILPTLGARDDGLISQNLMPTFGAPDLDFRERGLGDQPLAQLADPLYGQITLIAPPMTVTPETGQGAAMGLSFDWRDMAKGAGLVDYPALVTLAKTLPEGSKVLFPAIDPRQLRGGAVNLRLDPRVTDGLVAQGYGVPGRVNSWQSARMASDWHGGTQPIRLLPATMTPLNRPGRRNAGINPDSLPQGGTTAPAEEASRRMRFIDFLGLPIYLSPQLNTSPDLEQETRARITTEFMPRAPLVSPLAFSNLRSSLLGGFYGVEARPELGAWRQAAPNYEKAGSSISSLLSNRLRMGAMGDGVTSSRAPIPKSATLPTFGAGGKVLGPSFLPKMSGAAMSARAPLGASSFIPPTMSSASSPSSTPGQVPKFIRHQPGSASSPSSFRPSIPAISQSATAPSGQAATAPTGAATGSSIRVSPQITVAPEKMTAKAKSQPANQSPASPTRAAQPAPMEGPKPAKGPGMVPQSQFPRAASAPSAAKSKSPEAKAAPRPMDSHDQASGGSSLKPPQMLIAPPKPVSAGHGSSEPIAIQTSPSSVSGGASSESGASRSAEAGEKKESGLPGSEINLLATEVWILLKRRLAFESQRMGR